MSASLARIVKQGSLPSCIKWYVRLPAGTADDVSPPSFRTRTEARAWCDAHGIPWRAARKASRG